MDDLYGDLPPATGDTTIDLSSKLFSGDVKIPIIQRESNKSEKKLAEVPKTFAKESKVEKVVGGKAVPAETKPTSSTLLFKPRQTAISAPQVKHETQTINKKTVPVVRTTAVDQPMAVNQTKEASDEFNSTKTFDVTDPYDPRRPNDYLQFCEEREEQRRVKRLAEEQQRSLEEIQRKRAMLEEQRQKLVENQDYQRLMEDSGPGAGRGRGRGLSNLPAWMTEQLGNTAPKEADLPHGDRFQDK